ECSEVDVEPLPQRPPLTNGGKATLRDGCAQGGVTCGEPCRGGSGARDEHADRGRDESARKGEMRAAADQEGDREERSPRPEEARNHADREALDDGQLQEVSPARSACPDQGEIATLALDRAERGEVRESERDQRARDGQHAVEG